MHSSGNDGAAADNVTLAEEYGFCASACYRELGITADGTAHIVVREARDKQILNERSVQLSDDETGRVLGLATGAVSVPWAPRYGCPDCADQGAYSLLVRSGAAAQQTVLDPRQLSPTFDDLVTTLHAILLRELAN